MVISPSSSWYGNAGGVAYIGSFDWNSDTPTFVFSNMLGNGNEKYVTDATSHEQATPWGCPMTAQQAAQPITQAMELGPHYGGQLLQSDYPVEQR